MCHFCHILVHFSVLEDAKLKFVISNNTARTTVTYDNASTNFCDGKWRQVYFDKMGQQATISGPNLQTFTAGDPNADMPLALMSDIFLGGLKAGTDAMIFAKTNNLTLPEEGNNL